MGALVFYMMKIVKQRNRASFLRNWVARIGGRITPEKQQEH